MFGHKKPSTEVDIRREIDDATKADPAQLEKDAGPLGRAFINAVDKAVHLQTSSIRAYVDWLRRHSRIIQRIGGALLIIVGILLLTGQWATIVEWIRVAFISDTTLPV